MENVNALRTPADIVAAAPGLLGFVPTNSIVVYLLQQHPTTGLGVRCAARFDMINSTDQATNFPATCNLRAGNFAAAIILAVCDQPHDIHARHLVEATRDSLRAINIEVLRCLHTRDVTETGQWLDIDTGQYGPTYPYTDAVLTAQLVHRGHTIRAHRSEIEDEFSPLPPAPPAQIGNHARLVAATVEEITAALAGGPITNPTLATRAGILITAHPALRDAMIGLAVDTPEYAADLWTHIARRLRGAPRAEALTVAAACLCLNGDTVRAGIALDAAFDEAHTSHTPEPRLAGLLSAALRAGLSPEKISQALIAATEPRTPDTD
ncbi:hypothetical protein AO501_10550 [Mycobacterium gordonae]|uniref:DUF4192 domain-containing protein n=1 Tax=Mycobacterium gordonae TaxID=1778 RepID=A0A0Q2Q9V9_MYCGO|nr:MULTISPECIES: DUF4192 domain-containing protein [Mycobacterium]KQH76621.1 hypothetical protein AO501_10550 [Mycobacterium gordonae]MDP7732660.1 DUF4192 domain-containing protein [Mycobacterium sp. TY813]TDK88351.1 DUF4192 domain-containing protein [Mycobacterium paragordonae]